MSHNEHSGQPLPYLESRRRCGCPNLIHEHGCRNRYDKGCHCDTCRGGNTAKRRADRGMDPDHIAWHQYLRDEVDWFLTWHMTDERIAERVGATVDMVRQRRWKQS